MTTAQERHDARVAAFEEFHRRNPEVYRLLLRFSLEALTSGRRRYSIWAIVNRVRWHVEIETDSDDEFKLNNNHAPHYARLLMAKEPRLAGFFEIRENRALEVELEEEEVDAPPAPTAAELEHQFGLFPAEEDDDS